MERINLEGRLLESLLKLNGASSTGSLGSNSESINPGAHDPGLFLSPIENSLEKRFLETTSLESGLSLMSLREELFA